MPSNKCSLRRMNGNQIAQLCRTGPAAWTHADLSVSTLRVVRRDALHASSVHSAADRLAATHARCSDRTDAGHKSHGLGFWAFGTPAAACQSRMATVPGTVQQAVDWLAFICCWSLSSSGRRKHHVSSVQCCKLPCRLSHEGSAAAHASDSVRCCQRQPHGFGWVCCSRILVPVQRQAPCLTGSMLNRCRAACRAAACFWFQEPTPHRVCSTAAVPGG